MADEVKGKRVWGILDCSYGNLRVLTGPESNPETLVITMGTVLDLIKKTTFVKVRSPRFRYDHLELKK